MARVPSEGVPGADGRPLTVVNVAFPLARVGLDAVGGAEHVLARLILHEASARSLTPEPVEEFQAHPGAGVVATRAAERIVVGTRRLLQE